MQKSIAEREYQASRNDRGLQSPNRAHNIRTYYDGRGIRVVDRTAEGAPVLFELETQGLGRSAAPGP